MQTVFVGLSGGVDSAVSAALLKEQGYHVTGAFIKIWSPEFLECTWREDRLDAMRVCVALEIPFREIDLSREYRDMVVGDMIENYRRGITPNPDVLCNRQVKFGAFSSWAFAEGATLVATGHYAQVEQRGNVYSLLRGGDRAKDQSYFLYTLGQDDLRRTLFPIGGYEKREVRALAKRFDLPVAQKHDSQGLCFVGDVSLPEFLGRFILLAPGHVIDETGREIGTHDGAALYTKGQRHGIHAPGGPHFVTRIDIETNTVFVSTKREEALSREAVIPAMHWIEGAPTLPITCSTLSRYRGEMAQAGFTSSAEGTRVVFDDPQILSPGQSLVAYDGERCLGGGVMATMVGE